MQISNEIRQNYDYDTVDSIAEKFSQFWTQHASLDVMTLQRTPVGFNIFELYESESRNRAEILFCRALNGNKQIVFRIGRPAGQVFFFDNVAPFISEQKLIDIFDDFCRFIGAKNNSDVSKIGSVDYKSKNPTVIKRRKELLEMWPSIIENDTTDLGLGQHFGVNEATIKKDRLAMKLLKR